MAERKHDLVSELDDIASAVQRLAVLLAAGVAPPAAWGYLAEGERLRMLRSVGDAALAGQPIGAAIIDAIKTAPPAMEQAWRALAAAWQVASEAGASLAPSLRHFATSLRELAQTQRDVSVAVAGPVATARMVMVLPAVGVLFGLALGFDTLGTLFTTAPGWFCLSGGVALMLAARAWNRRMVARAQPSILTPGLSLDLMAIAVSGGSSLARATSLVASARESCGVAAEDSAESIDDILTLSRRAGVPAAELLRSEAEQSRRQARSDGQRSAATLAVKLMLPLGICILPAFMLLGVAPLVIAIISSTVSLV